MVEYRGLCPGNFIVVTVMIEEVLLKNKIGDIVDVEPLRMPVVL